MAANAALMATAIPLLKRAVDLQQQERLPESLVWCARVPMPCLPAYRKSKRSFQEAIAQLLKVIELETDAAKRLGLRSKVRASRTATGACL